MQHQKAIKIDFFYQVVKIDWRSNPSTFLYSPSFLSKAWYLYYSNMEKHLKKDIFLMGTFHNNVLNCFPFQLQKIQYIFFAISLKLLQQFYASFKARDKTSFALNKKQICCFSVIFAFNSAKKIYNNTWHWFASQVLINNDLEIRNLEKGFLLKFFDFNNCVIR